MLRIKFISFAFIDFILEPETIYTLMYSQFKECPLKCYRTYTTLWFSSLSLFSILFYTANSICQNVLVRQTIILLVCCCQTLF